MSPRNKITLAAQRFRDGDLTEDERREAAEAAHYDYFTRAQEELDAQRTA